MSMKLKLNHSGIRQILTGPKAQELMAEVGQSVAEDVSDQIAGHTWSDVDVGSHVTDRAVTRVSIHGANAGAYQVRDGVFTRAAANAGLDFKAPR